LIYASTNCLKNPKNLLKVLKEYEKAGIENVELGSVHTHFNVNELKKFNFNFIIHNYFPPPKISFNFNLASLSKSIRKKSIGMAKNAIDLCQQIKSPLYTFHAGFTVEPTELGKRLPRDKIYERKKSIETFVESVEEIIAYAKNSGVKIAMEPNVVQKFNLVKGKNELLLFADYPEIETLFKLIKKEDLGLLLDLGHTAVTSHWLRFNKDEFVNSCRDKVIAIHISNNNGLQDQHKSLTADCWQVSKIKLFRNIPIVLETMNLSTDQIIKNIQIAQNALSVD